MSERSWQITLTLLAFAILLALPAVIPSFYASLLAFTFAYVIAAVGVNLLTGYTGLVTVGHGIRPRCGGPAPLISGPPLGRFYRASVSKKQRVARARGHSSRRAGEISRRTRARAWLP